MMDDGGYKDEYGALLKMQNVDADDDDIEGRIVWLRRQDRTNEYLAAGGGEAIPNRIILVGAEDSDDDQDVDMSNPSIIIPDICHERCERRACKFFGWV